MLRTVPAVSASSQRGATQAGPRGGPALCDAAGAEPGRWPAAGQSHSLRQHGGAAEILHRRHLGVVARRFAGGEARWRFHGQPDHARWPGDHADFNDVAAPASRHGAGRPAIWRTRAACHAQRRHSLRRLARGRAQQELTEDERTLAQALGRRVALLALALKSQAFPDSARRE